ncbi:MAG: hypothetical protein OWR52_07595 [Acidibacillus sp.]|uniref:Uncharacterized protein n=1 Tax=Sulfoacidibacillus ferrooxidans TaxID=2005001 RepID=A0A9X1V7B1_9BACL|nr:hypothetical protein [Sulfoacidibacillus ferrooxidans]MCI0182856.1 hypothetical protein [Sulfoacidibacillus ferrooxidans]MCY0893355.1 hypothetical protein [Acidibacillus sp.]
MSTSTSELLYTLPQGRNQLKELHERPELVAQTLEEHQEAIEKISKLGLRPLSPMLKVTIWGLRLYVLFMVVVVIVSAIQNV